MRSKNKEPRKFTIKMQKKLVVLFVLVLLAFVALTVRLFAINKEDGDSYKKQVLSQQEYDSKVLPFKRGDIEDRNGSKLAYSEKRYNLIVDAKLMNSEDGKYLEPTLAALKKYFGNSVDTEAIRKYVSENPDSKYKKFAKELPYDEVSPYVEYETEAAASKDLKSLRGVWFEDCYVREYPYKTLACDVIGFTQGENQGYYGLEEYYNSILNGTDGREYGYLNEDAVVEQTIKPAVDGMTIVSTIDTNIQSIVEKHINAFNEEHKNEAREGYGSKNTGCIIMNPNSGEIYAMASTPAFDLNNPRDLSSFYSQEELALMDDEEKLEALNQIWRNFCISDTYEPGSTTKPFTVAAAIECGAITGNESYNCTGMLHVGDHDIHCHQRLGDGMLTVQQGIMKSCNVVLMDIAFAMGKEQWLKYNRMFNFGLKTNIDLKGEVNAANLVFDEGMGQTDLAISSFGQGFNATMIQQAVGFCSLINGGYYYQPRMVSRILNSEGAVMEDIDARVLKQTISNQTSDKIREMCNTVVMSGKEGTGWTARPAGYTMGGKTGTAEKYPRNKKNYVVSFAGYVPADDPQVFIYVVIDEPNVPQQDNARFATLLVKDIMTEVLPYMNIFMTESLSEEEREELAEKERQFSIGSHMVSGNSVSGNSLSMNGVSENSVSGNEVNDEKEDGESVEETVSKNEIQYDPETGFPIDPNTGEVLDPETGYPIDGNTSFMN